MDYTLPSQPAPPYPGQGYPGAPPPVVQPANPQVVVVQTQIPQHRISFGSNPTQMTCNNCKKQITTAVESKPSLIQWGICLAICFLGGGCGCCLIPFCIDSLANYDHDCPNCNVRVGSKNYCLLMLDDSNKETIYV